MIKSILNDSDALSLWYIYYDDIYIAAQSNILIKYFEI